MEFKWCTENNPCPIDIGVDYISKKWSLRIIKDMFFGKKQFKEFLESNPHLSGKVLSERLRDLQKLGIVKKNVVSSSPLRVEYQLTEKGMKLNRVIFELAAFGLEVCQNNNENYKDEVIKSMKEALNITD
ncbi:MAG: putative transcriptional regulator [Methanobacterium sp. Maddingley MBC34]|nr:MAG: putative transcriptional regulator [Methanobacterium sp. Maddingley MBC34]